MRVARGRGRAETHGAEGGWACHVDQGEGMERKHFTNTLPSAWEDRGQGRGGEALRREKTQGPGTPREEECRELSAWSVLPRSLHPSVPMGSYGSSWSSGVRWSDLRVRNDQSISTLVTQP